MEVLVKIELDLSDDVIQQLAHSVAERVGAVLEERRLGAQYMSVDEAADYLRCSKHRIYDLTSTRTLPHFKFGSRLLFSQKELDAWLNESKIDSVSPSRWSYEPPPRRTRRSSTRELATKTETPQAPRKRERPVPPPYCFSDEQKESNARALGLSRAEFDELTPREYNRLWKERVARLDGLTKEQKDAIFAWDPAVNKLTEMPMDEIEALANRLLVERSETSTEPSR